MSKWRSALLCSAALMFTSGASVAWAQAEEAPAPANQTEAGAGEAASDPAIDELVVVGSRIRRDTFNSPSPVQIMTREETTLAGYSSTTAALQGTAVTGGSAQINNAYGGYVTEGGPGANTIGLRGLGAGRTLVLIDGRRVAPAGSRGSVGSADLNVLPSAMIDRIEVLRDGASSIYGSDAVAGVVNVITRKNVDGLTVEGQYNRPSDEGGEQSRFSVVGGLSGDRWNLSGSLEYYERGELTLRDRDWTRCNTDYMINQATGERLDDIDPRTGQPKCYPITTTGSNGVTINTIGTNTIGGFNRWRPNSAMGGSLPGFEGVGGPGIGINVRDTFEDRMLNESLISPVKVTTGYIKGDYELHALGDAQAFFEVLANQRDSEQTGYRQLSLDYIKGSPLIPSNLAGSTYSSTPVSTSNGQPVGVRAFIGFGNDKSEQSVKFLKATAGLRGDLTFLPDWRYEVAATHTKSDAEYTMQSFITDRLAQSLNVTSVAGGGFACVDPSNGCVAAPALTSAVIGGQLPTDWVNYVFIPVTGTTEYTETVLSANIDGPLFELPAGKVNGAFGLEYRKAEIDDTPSIYSQQNKLYNLTSSAVTRGSDSVVEAFGEVEIPVLADLPFAEDLTFNVSGRFTDYESYGSDWTYKVGGVYTPIHAVSLRATYGTSFRAPALFEQFQGATSGFLANTSDPCHEYGARPTTSIRYQNCNAEIGNTGYLSTQSVEVQSQGGAAQGLEAETSKNFTVGLILQPELPEAFGDLSFAVDYYTIEIENGVSRVGGSAILRLCYDDPQFRAGGGWCRFIDERAAGSNKLTVHDSYTNIATQNVEGIDYNLRWTKDVGPGSLRLNAQVTQYLDQSSKLFADDPMDDVNGTIGNPKFTGTFDATYSVAEWKFRYGLEWLDGMDSYAYLGEDSATSDYVFATDDYFLHNVSVQYSTDDWTATVGVRNLADETPPSISSGYYDRVGNAPLYSGYDYVGRTMFVNFSKSF